MAAIIVNRGLQVIGEKASFVTPSFGRIQSMAVDDSVTAFAAGNTTLGGPTNILANPFDSDPTRASQTISHVMTLTTAQFNGFTVKRISLHDLASGSVTGTSTSLVSGVDGLSLVKASTFALTITFKHTYTSA